LLTPGPQRGQHAAQVPACLGQVIFKPPGLHLGLKVKLNRQCARASPARALAPSVRSD
jgi:hypothetical protein